MNIRNLILLALIILTVTACSPGNSGKETEETAPLNLQPGTSGSDQKIGVVVGIGKIEPETELQPLFSDRGGIIDTILKKEGESVRAGEIIMILNSDIEKLEVEKIKSRISIKQNQLRFDEASIAETEARLENRKKLLERSRELAAAGAETAQNIDDLETEYKVLVAGLEKNRALLAITGSEIRELGAELRSANAEISKRILRAPANGTVLDILLTRGSALGQYGKYAEFAPEGRLIARCEIDELFASEVKAGQNADITFVGRSVVLATGKVIKTTPYLKKKSLFSELAGDKEDRRVMEVWILLDKKSGLLYNSQVECIIKL
jgi:multidrug efflux pump subunit AcrA (membrane-fusion protein)